MRGSSDFSCLHPCFTFLCSRYDECAGWGRREPGSWWLLLPFFFILSLCGQTFSLGNVSWVETLHPFLFFQDSTVTFSQTYSIKLALLFMHERLSIYEYFICKGFLLSSRPSSVFIWLMIFVMYTYICDISNVYI